MNFRKAVREAAKEADLTRRERFKLGIVLTIPWLRRRLEQQLLEKAIEYQVLPPHATVDAEFLDNVDWQQVIDFIVTWLPIVLKLILIFL